MIANSLAAVPLWLSFKSNRNFPKKVQIILKGHFSLSLKMKTPQSAASSSPGMRQTHSQESLPPQTKEAAGSQRALTCSASPRHTLQGISANWHVAYHITHMHTHMHTHTHILSGLTPLKTSPCSMQPVRFRCGQNHKLRRKERGQPPI